MDIKKFKSVVECTINDVLGKRKKWFNGQPDATAFAMLLTCRLARLRRNKKHLLIGAPKSKETGRIIDKFVRPLPALKRAQMELMVDFLVTSIKSAQLQIPIIACESWC